MNMRKRFLIKTMHLFRLTNFRCIIFSSGLPIRTIPIAIGEHSKFRRHKKNYLDFHYKKNVSGYEYEKKTGQWDNGFHMDGEKFQVTGAVELEYKTFLYIYDNEFGYAYGLEILGVLPLKIDTKTV